MAGFVANKVQGMGGQPLNMYARPVAKTTSVEQVYRSSMDIGGVFVANAADAEQGVEITIVYASHVSNVSSTLLSEEQRILIEVNGTVSELGSPMGYILLLI